MEAKTYSGGKQAQSGNPNVMFVFVAVMLLLLGLVGYIYTRKPTSSGLLAQLPPAAEPTRSASASSSGAVAINPDGEALLAEVTSKPLDASPPPEVPKPKEASPAATPADEALPAAREDTASQGVVAADVDGAKVKSQVSSQTDYTYTVRVGETLFRIASRFGQPAAQIKQSNELADDAVQVGQSLKIRIQGLHKVAGGEGLAAIARTYGLPLSTLKKANELTSDNLRLGQELVIPNR